MRHVELSDRAKITLFLLQDGYGPRFCRHVESPHPWIEDQNIRIFANLVDGEKLHHVQIKYRE